MGPYSPTTEIELENWILILLGVNEKKAINGNLMFIKQLFLLENEVISKLENRKPFKFYPYDLGPYSSVAAKKINEFVQNGIIEAILIDAEKNNFQYRLTPKGREKAVEAMEKLPAEIIDDIKKKRKGWDQLGYYGIVRKVYHEYPEYTIHSKIKERVYEY